MARLARSNLVPQSPELPLAYSGKIFEADVTIIIPTLNEAGPIRDLLLRLSRLYPDAGILVIDDESRDGTPQIVEEVRQLRESQSSSGDKIKLIERSERAVSGLCASILEAICACETKYFVVMDADFQHPPEVVSDLISCFADAHDLVVGCRLPDTSGQPLNRRLVSRLATLLARIVLHYRGQSISDPLSGFFGGETRSIRFIAEQDYSRFELRGYKVLFDLLKIGGDALHVEQLYYEFAPRPLGTSKLRLRHGLYFFRSLLT